MARLFSILAICALAVFAVAGCGDSDDDSGATTEATNAAATGAGDDGDAMKKGDADGDAMKKDDADGDAMKSDEDDAMKKEGDDAMKSDDDAMKHEGDDDSMKHEDDAMKKEASASGDAMVASRKKKRRRGKFVKAVGSDYGRVVADGRGEAFYLFDKEGSKRSRCYGACARAWPPVITKGKPRAGKGVKQRLLGVTRRKNGKLQVTYRNHPLYYYVDDSPGTILCQNVDEFGGLWLVVRPNGNPVT
jgi:predicted lipoprotein with Yx(FWY)xxD motif